MAQRTLRLTAPLLDAMACALHAALIGAGFDGELDGKNPEHFQRALQWVEDKRAARQTEARQRRRSLAIERQTVNR